MAQLMVLYHTPEDSSAFDAHYARVHIPLAKSIPGLRDYQISNGPASTPDGHSPYHLIATLTFDSVDAIKAGLSPKEGGAAGADLGNFATGGANGRMFVTSDVQGRPAPQGRRPQDGRLRARAVGRNTGFRPRHRSEQPPTGTASTRL